MHQLNLIHQLIYTNHPQHFKFCLTMAELQHDPGGNG